jgi:hypothetical protein
MDLRKKRNWFKLSFLFLLPLFFVFHGFTENYHAIPAGEAAELFFIYLLASLLIFLAAWLFYKNTLKAALFSFFLLSINFFFGALQDFLKKILEDAFFTRYSFLIPFLFCLLVALTVYLKKTKARFNRFTVYLNLLFCILILLDAIALGQKIMHRSQTSDGALKYNVRCDSCTRPDIYFVVFDEYSSTAALKETWNYDNSELDSFLAKKGFKLLPHSNSNYNFTEFSIASTLNMEYLQIPEPLGCTIKDYNKCFELIRSNKVCTILSAMGYDIVNYSIFDLQKNPSPIKEDFLPLKTRLITSQTFLGRVEKDLLHLLLVGRFEVKWLSKNLMFSTYRNNQKIIGMALHDSLNQSASPRFVYAHIQMPHPPFYFDKYGRVKKAQEVIKDNNTVPGYLDYLPKTNEVVKQVVNNILNHSKKPVTILLTSDHGFREHQERNFQFRNMNALYMSTGNYTGFYDSISGVNQFRVLFNNLFKASFPLKRDSTIFLADKK